MAIRATPPNVRRFWALVLSLFLGYSFVVQPLQQIWKDYWLLKDGQQGTARVTEVRWTGHGGIAYQYRVNQVEYTGVGAVRGYKAGRGDMSPPSVIGEHVVVYYSVSHPWLSQTDRPSGLAPYGLPLLLLMWALEAFLIVTVINPNSRWALAMHDHRFFNRY